MTEILVILLLAMAPLLVGLALAYVLLQEHPLAVTVKTAHRRTAIR